MSEVETIVLDACSLINLINGGNFDAVLGLSNKILTIGEVVYNEVAKIPSQKRIIDSKIASGELQVLNEDIPLEVWESFQGRHELGDGETECLCFARLLGHKVCCDDKLARKALVGEFGSQNLIGSLRLLKWSVEQKIIPCNEARFSYLEMKLKGGFLPTNVPHNYFCAV